MKKIILSLIIAGSLICSYDPIYAASSETSFEILDKIEAEFFEPSYYIDDTMAVDQFGNYLQFATKQERDLFVSSTVVNDNSITPYSFNGQTATSKPIRNLFFSQVFIGYNPHTPSWSKASSYAVAGSKNTSVGTTLNYGGISFTVSGKITTGATTNIPADANRWSRLGFLGDISATQYEVKIFHYGRLVQTSYPISGYISATYNSVIYQ